MSSNDDEVIFIEEPEASLTQGEEIAPAWFVLIVDDDEDVHRTTEYGLKDLAFLGRGVRFLNAYSVHECTTVLLNHPDVAVILLDVVMETQDAGLTLVDIIRRELNLHLPRIILRTGQPGYAPELDAIRDYDINDYRTKNELTRKKLFTSVLTAIRAYDQLQRMEASRFGLEQIVKGSSELIAQSGLQAFASGVIRQLAVFVGTEPEGLLCAQADFDVDQQLSSEYLIIAAAGSYQALVQRRLDEVGDMQIHSSLQQCFNTREHVFARDHIVLYFEMRNKRHFAVYIRTHKLPSAINRDLLQAFCANVSICADNVNLINQLRESAYVDKLVGLPNRTAFIDAINQHFVAGTANAFSVILIDVDHFAEINNAFGHQYGDQLLKSIAHRLVQGLGQESFIARIAGDSFGVLSKTTEVNSARIRRIIERPLYIDGMEHVIPFSTGTVRLSDSTVDGQSVLKDASIARKLAKQSGINSDAIYSLNISKKAKEQTQLLRELQAAFEQGLLFPMYQPQVNMKTGQVLGFEALMRWQTVSGTFISPLQFIGLAEQSGLIVSMGAWILRRAMVFMRELKTEGLPGEQMSVNVSAAQFRRPDFLSHLCKFLDETGLHPKYLELEITESIAMMEHGNIETTLSKLQGLGVKIAIDDFGTGFSSLSYLDRLPINRIKIDRSFVNNLTVKKGGKRITELVVQLGHSLGMRIIAEGVESEDQARCLLNMGCQEAQGFLYARPMVGDELKKWLRNSIAR